MGVGKGPLVRRRTGAGARAAGTALVAATLTVLTTTGPAAEPAEASSRPAPGIALETFTAQDFAAQARDLPPGLKDAVQRDLGVSVEQYLAEAAAAQSASNVVDTLRASGVGIEAAAFERESQTLHVVPVTDADREAIEATGAVVAETLPSETELGSHIVPHDEFKGGYGYGEPGPDGQFASYCTAGFTGYAADGSSVVLTAGHCFPQATADTRWAYVDIDEPWTADTPGWPAPGADLGVGIAGRWQFGHHHDAGLFRLDESAWSALPVVSTWGDGTGDPSDGEIVVTDHVAPIVGQPVCRSGVTSGHQCGEILAVDQDVDYGEHYGNAVVTGFLSSACSAPGDSGGPFLSGTAAVGVLSGAGGPESDRCEDWNAETDVSFGYPLSGSNYSAEALYAGGEWELAVAVAAPEVATPGDAADVGLTPVISGRVPYGGRHHAVTITVAGRTYTAPVEAGGGFSVEITDPLSASSDYTYQVRARYGRHSRSETVSGRLSVASPEETDLDVLPRTGPPTAWVVLGGLLLIASGLAVRHRHTVRSR